MVGWPAAVGKDKLCKAVYTCRMPLNMSKILVAKQPLSVTPDPTKKSFHCIKCGLELNSAVWQVSYNNKDHYGPVYTWH